ncbi:hypothetical protein G7043_34040 [Lentzea sp. NEAU-D13]|uniref:Uncharacterized protein n=1 Tax=Lentzea alba TaxID=2714351 RepID=A0A7C9VT98_9PSEU|nr:hypothetical protein [Lentzea alba]NGY63954.1 hypothetical protein [Lentzea alba]
MSRRQVWGDHLQPNPFAPPPPSMARPAPQGTPVVIAAYTGAALAKGTG